MPNLSESSDENTDEYDEGSAALTSLMTMSGMALRTGSTITGSSRVPCNEDAEQKATPPPHHQQQPQSPPPHHQQHAE